MAAKASRLIPHVDHTLRQASLSLHRFSLRQDYSHLPVDDQSSKTSSVDMDTVTNDKARTRMVQWCFLGMCCWNLIISLDSTALAVALPVSCDAQCLLHQDSSDNHASRPSRLSLMRLSIKPSGLVLLSCFVRLRYSPCLRLSPMPLAASLWSYSLWFSSPLVQSSVVSRMTLAY